MWKRGLMILTEKQLLDILPFGRSTLRKKIKNKEFPAPRQVSERRIGWLDSEVKEWEKNTPIASSFK